MSTGLQIPDCGSGCPTFQEFTDPILLVTVLRQQPAGLRFCEVQVFNTHLLSSQEQPDKEQSLAVVYSLHTSFSDGELAAKARHFLLFNICVQLAVVHEGHAPIFMFKFLSILPTMYVGFFPPVLK